MTASAERIPGGEERPEAATGTLETSRALRGGPRARRAAILCADPDFRDYLEQKHGLPARTKAETVQAVRALCGPPGKPLESRVMIDHDDDAKQRFDTMRTDFAGWRQGIE
jgi:hypothetical protein